MLKRSFVLLALIIATVFSLACEDSPEDGMAVFAVSDINGGSPVVVAGGTAVVPMVFRWRPYFDVDGVITEAFPHGDFIVEHYRITWTAVTSGATIPAPREGTTAIFVPVYELVPASIAVVTAAEAGAVAPGSVLNAHIEFTAREMGTEQEAKFATVFPVTF